jgi:hypothetical protein
MLLEGNCATKPFYRRLHDALTPDGVLVTGVLTYPSWSDQHSDWALDKIPPIDIEMERMIALDILDVGWANYRRISEAKDDFLKAGFSRVEIYNDNYCVFPAIKAFK